MRLHLRTSRIASVIPTTPRRWPKQPGRLALASTAQSLRSSYVVAHVSGRIVVFAEGMQGFCGKLPAPVTAACLATGANAVEGLPCRLLFPLF
jgi:hypothetical protein